jgi:phosphoenolpyruvate---glycerone phosphotransferase subunit DhaM
MVVGIVLVSHSRTLAEGLLEMVAQVAGSEVRVAIAAGTPDGRLGTSAPLIVDAIRAVDGPEGVLVLLDLGSAVLSIELALEELEEDERGRVVVSDGPLVEGAVVAAVQASVGAGLAEVAAEAAAAARISKSPGGAPV